MDGGDRQSGAEPVSGTAPEMPVHDAPGTNLPPSGPPQSDYADESLIEEVSALIDDGRNYAEAELRFQKTRAKLAGKLVGAAGLALVIALILFHIALLALAVGLVIALEPIVTIWGAIAIVVGALLLLAALLVHLALKRSRKLSALFSQPEDV